MTRRRRTTRTLRATSGAAHFDLDPSTPAGAAATAAVAGPYLDRSRVNAEDLIASEPDEPAEWHALAALCTIDVWLSVDEVVEGAAALAAVVDSDQTEPCATVPRARAGCES